MSRRSGPDPRDRVRALRDPVARSRRLELTFPDPSRADEIVPLLNDAEVARWTLHIPYPYRARDARAYFRRWRQGRKTGEKLSLHIVRRSDRALVGGIGLNDISSDHLRAEIGYWIGRPFRGQGYAREAVEALVRLGFRSLRLLRIEAGVFPANAASARVLRATGFRREGRMRQSIRKDGLARDVDLYARLRDDPPPSAASGGRARRPSRSRGASGRPTR